MIRPGERERAIYSLRHGAFDDAIHLEEENNTGRAGFHPRRVSFAFLQDT